MATLKPPMLRFRENNPNLFQLRLLLGNTPIVPTDELALSIELRADPSSRALKVLSLVESDSESDVSLCSLPDLADGQYYVNLVAIPTALPAVRSGLCQFVMLPEGSLETISDVQGMTAVLDQTMTILSASLDSSLSSTLAAVAAEESNQEAQEAKADTFQYRNEAQGFRNESEGFRDETLQAKDDLFANFNEVQADITQKAEQVSNGVTHVDGVKEHIDSVQENIDTQQVDVNQKAQQVAQDKVATGLDRVATAQDRVATGISANNAHTSEVNAQTAAAQLTTLNTSTTLTDAATIVWDVATASIAKVTLGGNRILQLNNAQNNQFGQLFVFQDATGGRALTLPGNLGNSFNLKTAPNAVDVISWQRFEGVFYWDIIGYATSPQYPIIDTQPVAQGFLAGTTLSVSIAATGVGSYQWQMNGVNIAGANSSVLTIQNCTSANQGIYACILTNAVGSRSSNAVQLTVGNPTAPTITTQPVAQSIIAPAALNLSVVGSGLPVPSCQWYKDSVAIPGATALTYSVTTPTVANSGNYYVVLTNTAGSVQSNTVAVLVRVLETVVYSDLLFATDSGGGTIVKATGSNAGGMVSKRLGKVDGSYIEMQLASTFAESQGVALCLDNSNETGEYRLNFTSGNYIVAVYQNGDAGHSISSLIQPGGTFVQSSTTAAQSSWIRLEISGNDVLVKYSTDRVNYSLIMTKSGVLSGITNIYPRIMLSTPTTGVGRALKVSGLGLI